MITNIIKLANFKVGQVIRHRLFDYRGVIFDVDPIFSSTDEWYETMARTCPPKDRPWYHVLVDNATHTTYVAEQNLSEEINPKPIFHPALKAVFGEFSSGKYQIIDKFN